MTTRTITAIAADLDTAIKNLSDRDADMGKKQMEVNVAADELNKAKTKVQNLRAEMNEVLNMVSNPPNDARVRTA